MQLDECRHGIFPEQACTICNGSDKKREDEERGKLDRTLTASYSGVCGRCRGLIEPGETIGQLTNKKYICDECVEKEQS